MRLKTLSFLIGPGIGIVFLFLLISLLTSYTHKEETYTIESSIIKNTEDNEKLKEIRTRENVKMQQELIVKEIYLMEEKERVEKEKEEAIIDFDLQITEIEKNLESVRESKLSF